MHLALLILEANLFSTQVLGSKVLGTGPSGYKARSFPFLLSKPVQYIDHFKPLGIPLLNFTGLNSYSSGYCL